VRIFLPPETPLAPAGPGHFWEKRILAAPIHELRTRPSRPGYERVLLKPSPDTSSYPRYRRAFEDLLQDSPSHREYTRMETEEDLGDLAKAGTLFDVLVDGHWSGITAVDVGNEEGAHGYRMIEILLARHARGQRLGSALQRRLIEALPDRRKLLLGTIDVRNVAAIRAAERVGRRDVGGYLWVAV
jgi:GNAT superfamily N-acetyltransferase